MTPTELALKTIDWHKAAIDALESTKQSVQMFSDEEDVVPEEATFTCVAGFLNGLPNEPLSTLPVPHINPGPNGELGVNWILDKGTLNLIFFKGFIEGYLQTPSGSKTATTIAGAVELVDWLAGAEC